MAKDYTGNFYNSKAWLSCRESFISKRVGDGVIKDEEKLKSIQLEKEIEMIRLTREEECFSVINRGGIWYDTLTEQEKSELMEWYQGWLDAPQTMIIPDFPEWLKE